MLPTPSTFRPESLVGTTLDGRYRLVAHIASGGMGAIFRAEHVYMRKELAIKVLRPDLSSLPDIAERFRREAEIAASLEHDNIVRVTDFGRSPEGWLFLAMELLEGESLFDRLRRAGPLSPQESVSVLVQMCRGLEAAHARGVVHRDLKPENIFLTARPAGLIKILDFGIAKLTDPQIASDTQAGMVVGTPEYLSPEQATGSAVDGRADVYAVGLIGWRMLAGHHPFRADDARGLLMMQATQPVPSIVEARPDLTAWPVLVTAIGRACAKDARERHPSVAELGAELESCLGTLELPVPARPSESRSRTRAWTPPSPSSGPLPAAAAPTVQATMTLDAGTPIATPLPVRVLRFGRAHRLALGLVLAAAVLLPTSMSFARWMEERPAARARALLAADRPEAARDAIAPAVLRRPSDARLRVLHGQALHRIRGQTMAAMDAYTAALDLDPRALDATALSDLGQDLQAERKVAERSAKLLARVGPPAAPYVLEAVEQTRGNARLRVLELARDMGLEDRLDRVAVYGALLSDPDCDVRRAAVRRLGELGNPAALPRLHELAREKRRIKGLFGLPQEVPTCGAPEAEAAARKLTARR
ncbi:serine/threonine-protein kinase [Anaeromyxobacter diazotrophicus]|uniref:serine/threonine-protein kinase n=1 Tax=Anaeromyxobacter diazotrophicus TaxID=2590199 RepID=UPI001590D1CE|nr:serine/threonine-protein kinase [Anaeromyxobacter diazotrophicus]